MSVRMQWIRLPVLWIEKCAACAEELAVESVVCRCSPLSHTDCASVSAVSRVTGSTGTHLIITSLFNSHRLFSLLALTRLSSSSTAEPGQRVEGMKFDENYSREQRARHAWLQEQDGDDDGLSFIRVRRVRERERATKAQLIFPNSTELVLSFAAEMPVSP